MAKRINPKSATEFFGAGFRTWKNHLPLVLPHVAYSFFLLAWMLVTAAAGFFYLFLLCVGWSRTAGPLWVWILFKRLPVLALGLLCFGGVFALGAMILNSCHRAGYHGMTRRAVISDKCGIRDYFSSMTRFAPRFVVGGFIESGLKLMPLVLLIAGLVFAAGTGMIGKLTAGGGAWFWVIIFSGFLVLTLAWELLVNFLLALWQPYVVIENSTIQDAIAESSELALNYTGDLVVVVVLRVLISGGVMFASGLIVTIIGFGIASAAWYLLQGNAGAAFDPKVFLNYYQWGSIPAGFAKFLIQCALFAYFVAVYNQFVLDRLYHIKLRKMISAAAAGQGD